MEKTKSVAKALLDTLYWFIGNALFGIFPLLLIYYLKALGATNSGINIEFYNLLRGGIIIFFFCSLMGSIAIDLIIAGNMDTIPKRRKLLFKFVLIQVPFIILISLVLVYLLVVLNVLSKDYLMLGSPFVIFIIVYSGAYCFVYKFYTFGREEKLWS